MIANRFCADSRPAVTNSGTEILESVEGMTRVLRQGGSILCMLLAWIVTGAHHYCYNIHEYNRRMCGTTLFSLEVYIKSR